MFDEFAFRDSMRRNGIRLKDVASALNISTTTLHRKLSGESDFTRTEIAICCNLFGAECMHRIFFATEVP